MKRCYQKKCVQATSKGSVKTKKRVNEVPESGEGMTVSFAHEEVQRMILDGVEGIAIQLGMLVATGLMEDEVRRLCGERYMRNPGRDSTRYGHQTGFITMDGAKHSIVKPRVRSRGGVEEVGLETYETLQRNDAMPRSAMKRMVHGVSCRNYEKVVNDACDGYGINKSSVSRSFVKASASEARKLMERRFEDERFVVIYIDGVEYASETMIVVLGIRLDGQKVILGLRQGGTENSRVCASLLEDLRDRGLDTNLPTLFVLDGSKALKAAVERVFGNRAVIQRCRVHKKRNVRAHLQDRYHSELDRRLGQVYMETSYDKALRMLRSVIAWLEKINPDAASSLREGAEETLTVTRLGVHPTLMKTLATTNPVESALSVVRDTTRRVKRWRAGDMKLRWCSTGLLQAESRFRRVKGYRHLHQFEQALDLFVSGQLDSNSEVA